MAVGDTLLFTLRGAIGETDVLITATEPKFDGASVTVSPEVEVSDASGVGPKVNIRFFRQNADGSFTALYSLSLMSSSRRYHSSGTTPAYSLP